MADYQNLTNDEVLQIASERDQLTDDARTALDSELARRSLSPGDIRSHRIACQAAEKVEKARIGRQVFGRSSFNRSGCGIQFLGKRKLHRDPAGRFEEYDSTRWVVIFWIPIYPMATFTVRRTLTKWPGMVFRSDPVAVQRHARDWEQILLTWIEASAVLLVLRLAWLYLAHHPDLLRRIFR